MLLDAGAVDGPKNEIRQPARGVFKEGRPWKPALVYAKKKAFTEMAKLFEGKQLALAVDWRRSTSEHKVYISRVKAQYMRSLSDYPYGSAANPNNIQARQWAFFL